MQKRWLNIGLVILGLLAALFLYNRFKVAPDIKFAQLALSNLNGEMVKFTDYKGKKLIVCFSASWCGNCHEELALLKSVKQKELADVEVIVISDEPMEKIVRFKNWGDFPFTFLKMEQRFSDIGINSIPTSYIVNTQLEIKEETVGIINWDNPATLHHLKKLME